MRCLPSTKLVPVSSLIAWEKYPEGNVTAVDSIQDRWKLCNIMHLLHGLSDVLTQGKLLNWQVLQKMALSILCWWMEMSFILSVFKVALWKALISISCHTVGILMLKGIIYGAKGQYAKCSPQGYKIARVTSAPLDPSSAGQLRKLTHTWRSSLQKNKDRFYTSLLHIASPSFSPLWACWDQGAGLYENHSYC